MSKMGSLSTCSHGPDMTCKWSSIHPQRCFDSPCRICESHQPLDVTDTLRALRIKILKIKIGTSIEDVLLRALDPPAVINIQRAVASLVEVKALTTTEEITPMGRLLSKLPMDVHLGKFLLMAALFRCLDPALTIAATLNGKSPFVAPFGMEHQADLAKSSFKTGEYLHCHSAHAARE